ncbi:MAG TPA: DNA repair protein RadC [Armatimonadota bacterium]
MYLPRYKVALVKEGRCRVSTRAIANPADAYAILHGDMGQSDREIFLTLLLDTRNRVIGIHEVSVGSLNASLVHPRETFKAAILTNAAALILAHCHPSGDLEPSQEDLAITTRLKEAGELLGIPVLDHLIISDVAFISLKERRLL